MFSNLASKVSNVFVWLFLFFNFVFGDVFIEPNPNEPMEYCKEKFSSLLLLIVHFKISLLEN